VNLASPSKSFPEAQFTKMQQNPDNPVVSLRTMEQNKDREDYPPHDNWLP